MDVTCTVNPCNCGANRRLCLSDNQRQAVYDQHNIETLAAFLDRVDPLTGNFKLIVGKVGKVYQLNLCVLAALAKGHGLFTP